jgi:hypothetical protein
MGRACRMKGGNMNTYRIFVVNSEGKRQLGRPRRGWTDDIKKDLREVG